MNDNKKAIKEIIEYASSESDIGYIELLNDFTTISDIASEFDLTTKQVIAITNQLENDYIFNALEIGDTINYDMLLKNGSVKNETMLILDKDTKTLKLNRLDHTWYCSKELFDQLLNVVIIK